jgi:hypothetical protein
MYSFYEVSVFHFDLNNRGVWAVVTLEGGHSTIVWTMDLEEDALDERAIRLIQGADRMTRYRNNQLTYESSSLSSPSDEEVSKYVEDNNIIWPRDLEDAVLENWTCTRLTRSAVGISALNS